MNKQQKQLIVLVVLIVVGGGVAAWQLKLFGGDTPPNTTASNVGAINIAANPNPGAGPTPGPGANPNLTVGAAGQAGTQGAAAAVVSKYQTPGELPAKETVVVPTYTWTVSAPDSGENWEKERGRAFWQYDPLFVQNLDVVEPDRKKYIDELRAEWILDGITEMEHIVKVELKDDQGKTILDAEGNAVTRDEKQKIPEAWFQGRTRPFKEKDRLPGTRFVIEKIYSTPMGKGILLRGDTGALIDMPLIKSGRYED
jgi:hypothetical protein